MQMVYSVYYRNAKGDGIVAIDKNTKLSDIDLLTQMKGLVSISGKELSTKEDITSGIEKIEERINEINSELGDVDVLASIIPEDAVDNAKQEAIKRKKELEDERGQLDACRVKLEEALESYKNFDKGIFFKNLRSLLKSNPDVKVGQIERDANVRLGYTARLEKEDNTAEPSVEFVVTAAKLLGVGVDTMLRADISGMTPTELYLVKFFDKLKLDTIDDKLDWNRETKHVLDRIEPDMNGWVDHPLFSEETFYEESECEYPEEVTRIVFTSKSFGPRTCIAGDCYNLRMKNGTTLYLMDIEKSVHRVGDPTAFAKEAWVSVPYKGCSLLVGTHDNSPLVPLLESLFETVKDRMEHPKINKDVKSAIDAFLVDDLDDDPTDDSLPFN